MLSQVLHNSGRTPREEEELDKQESQRHKKKKEVEQIKTVVFSLAYLCENMQSLHNIGTKEDQLEAVTKCIR